MSRLRKLGHMNGQWIVIADDRDDVEAQSVITADESDGFPHDRIKSQWGFSRKITQIFFAEKTWVIVMESMKSDDLTKEVTSQRLHFSDNEPEDEIKNAWAKGEKVVVLEPLSNGKWVMVAEKIEGPVVGQSLIFSTEPLPSKDIQQIWKDEKRVVSMAFIPSTWVIVAEKSPTGGQAYTGNSDWPDAKIAARQAEGMGISSIAYNSVDEAWAMTFDPKIKNQRVVMSKEFPEDVVKKELGCSRYGKRFY